MIPSTFRPTVAADFIGPAKTHAAFIERLVAQAKPTGDPLAVLLLGKPGIGKSALAAHFVRTLGADKWQLSKFNGASFRIEEVENYARDLQLCGLGGYRVLQIEEVDRVPNAAQVRMLTLLDDLPKFCAVVATSNCKLKELEERFQRRFTVMTIEPPASDDILSLLLKLKLSEANARQIATFACGNVGQALKDADLAMAA